MVIVVTAPSRHALTAAPLVMVPAPETAMWLPRQIGYGQ